MANTFTSWLIYSILLPTYKDIPGVACFEHCVPAGEKLWNKQQKIVVYT